MTLDKNIYKIGFLVNNEMRSGKIIFLIAVFLLIVNVYSVGAEVVHFCGIGTGQSFINHAGADNPLAEYLIVMKLSGQTNAHASIYNPLVDEINPSDYYFGCTFVGLHTCVAGGSNKIIGISSDTNAHAEIPSLDNYATDICFSNIASCVSCDVGNPTCLATNCVGEKTFMAMSLSSETNAHIGGVNDYPKVICCKHNIVSGSCGDNVIQRPNGQGDNEICDGVASIIDEDCVSQGFDGGTLQCLPNCLGYDTSLCTTNTPTSFWASSSMGGKIVEANVGDTVYMIVKNFELNPGVVYFEIKENDLIIDDDIRTGENAISTTVDLNGDAFASWIITEADLLKSETGDYEEFYFYLRGISGTESEDYLKININQPVYYECSDFNGNPSGCGDDDLVNSLIARNSVGDRGSECGTETDDGCSLQNCRCIYDIITNVCEGTVQYPSTGECEGVPDINRGECVYTSTGSDTCEGGFLHYSWTAAWTWGTDNDFGTSCTGDLASDTNYWVKDGKCRYDPLINGERYSVENCQSGDRTLPCIGQVSLPFFGAYNFIISIISITLIYLILEYRKKRALS